MLCIFFTLLRKDFFFLEYCSNIKKPPQLIKFLYFKIVKKKTTLIIICIATYVISAYHHYSCEFESRSWHGVLDTTLCDIKFVNDLLQVGGFLRIRWFPLPINLTATI